MTEVRVPYTGMPSSLWSPPAPQLIKNARMIIIGYKADPAALAAALPSGLSPHPNHMVQMNMYELPAGQSSGFGDFSLTYLSIEVEGHDSLAAEGTVALPGRFFAYYWNSSPRMITYAREAAGIPARFGVRRGEVSNGQLTSTLTVDDHAVITATASVTDNGQGTLGGHLNYYAHRQFPAPKAARPRSASLSSYRYRSWRRCTRPPSRTSSSTFLTPTQQARSRRLNRWRSALCSTPTSPSRTRWAARSTTTSPSRNPLWKERRRMLQRNRGTTGYRYFASPPNGRTSATVLRQAR
jgi:acetoacetate decarboxylase